VAVYGTDLRPQAVGYDIGHQLEVAVFHIAAVAAAAAAAVVVVVVVAVVAPQQEAAAGGTGHPGQAVDDDIDLPPLVAAFDNDHPCLLVAVCDTDPPRMDVQPEASSGGSSEELPHPRDQLA
jgi:hypothetical protein